MTPFGASWTRCPTGFGFIVGMEKPLASIRSWFRTIRSMYDLEQNELAEILGISRSTLANYEKNYTPPNDVIQRTIDAFPVVPTVPIPAFNKEHPEAAAKITAANQEFLGLGLELVSDAPSTAKVDILFAGDVPASSEWGDALSGTDTIPISAKIGSGPGRFACRVVGSSCEPCLWQNDIAVFKRDQRPMRGTIILAQNRSDYGCTVKELGWDRDTNKPSLLPINRYFEEPTDPEGWDAVAKLIGLEFVYEGIEMTAYEPSGIRPEQLAFRGFRNSTQKMLDSMPKK